MSRKNSRFGEEWTFGAEPRVRFASTVRCLDWRFSAGTDQSNQRQRCGAYQSAGWYQRALRAHANCVENLPVYAGIVVCATVAQATAPLLDMLALIMLGARLCQTTTHVAFEQTDRVVAVRFSFFFVQMLCMFAMGIAVAMSAARPL